MKISKQKSNINSSEEVIVEPTIDDIPIDVISDNVDSEIESINEEIVPEIEVVNVYQPARDYIKSAIEYLATNHSEDEKSREAIANLSVVLVDLS